MVIKSRKSWHIASSEATPEALFFSRRSALTGAGALVASALAGSPTKAATEADPTAALYPAKRNEAYTLDRPETPEKLSGNYNNFYEFGESKYIASYAQDIVTRPWTLTIDGLVEKPLVVDIDTLIKAMSLEERLYRHRCVETWSMAVPWTGFPLSALVAYAKPLSGAKYLRFETFKNAKFAPYQEQSFYPWPYIEGVTMAEAMNELALMVTGVYGKPLPKQFGAPLRLALPWKYGFKSIKSIVRVSFTDKRPVSFWEQLGAAEYGFWANVNPKVPHPRWSQESEQVLGAHERRPTLLFNGYAEQVAGLYKGLENEPLYK